jgi:hypothetical protein
MAKIEGQLLDSNAVKIFKKKKSMQTQDLTNVIKSTFKLVSQTSLLCAHTLNNSPTLQYFYCFVREYLCKDTSITDSPHSVLPQSLTSN